MPRSDSLFLSDAIVLYISKLGEQLVESKILLCLLWLACLGWLDDLMVFGVYPEVFAGVQARDRVH